MKTDFTKLHDWEVIASRVAPSVLAYMTALDNAGWSSFGARVGGLRSFRMAIAQLDSSEIDESKFVSQLALLMIRTVLPWGLEAAADLYSEDGMNVDKESNRRLNAAADGCRPVPDLAASGDSGGIGDGGSSGGQVQLPSSERGVVSDGYSCLVGDGKAGIGAIGVAVGGGDIGTVGGRVGSTAGVAPRSGMPIRWRLGSDVGSVR